LKVDPSAGNAERLAEAAAGLGIAMPVELLEQPSRPFLVWPENAEAVSMFCRLQTQWRTGPRGPIGLDYGAAQWLFSLCGVTQPLALLEDIQTMEGAFLMELQS
jgi:hypothetical protein